MVLIDRESVDNLGGLIFIGFVVVFVRCSYQQGRPGAIAFNANRSPQQVVVAALQRFSGHGWTTALQTDLTISFARTHRPGCLVTAQPDGGAATGSMVNIAGSRNGGGRGPSLAFKELIASGAPIAINSSLNINL